MSRADARDVAWRTLHGPLAPWCQTPVTIHAIGLPGLLDRGGNLPLDMAVACRKCEGCLKHRRNLWAARAADEIRISRRTWFLTLTVAPEHRFRLGLIAEKRFLRASAETLSDLTPEEQYKLLAKVLNIELTLMLKRVRKKNGPFRYFAVFERHKDGFPHLHLFIHEKLQPLTKSAIQAEWRLGFSQCKLVEQGPKAAFYAAKYLAKEAATRVRASVRYGRATAALLTEQLQEICDAVATTTTTTTENTSSKKAMTTTTTTGY